MDKTTVIKAGSGASSILPAIAIIGAGYLGYKALSGVDFGGITGGIAGGIAGGITERIESFTTTNIKDRTKSVFVASENSTEADVFTKPDGTPEKHNGKTYSQWVAELPPAQRAAVAAGNMLTGNAASEYGAYVRDKTLSSISKTTGRDELSIRRLYNEKSPVNKALIALGQAVTVPFIDGGAANLGAKVGMKKQKIKTGVSNWVSTGVTSGKPEALGVSIVGTVKSATSGASSSTNVSTLTSKDILSNGLSMSPIAQNTNSAIASDVRLKTTSKTPTAPTGIKVSDKVGTVTVTEVIKVPTTNSIKSSKTSTAATGTGDNKITKFKSKYG